MATDAAVYWDASAIVSVFAADANSSVARRRLRRDERHLVSSLAHSEVCAAMARIQIESGDGLHRVFAVAGHLRSELWEATAVEPAREVVEALAERWPRLRGADLWHLSAALTLRLAGTPLHLLTFDTRLREAAVGEGLAA